WGRWPIPQRIMPGCAYHRDLASVHGHLGFVRRIEEFSVQPLILRGSRPATSLAGPSSSRWSIGRYIRDRWIRVTGVLTSCMLLARSSASESGADRLPASTV